MSIQFISVKCPECGSSLRIEENRNDFFCTYCGAKILMNNENEHIIRNIDEARMKEAETDRMIKLRQLELETESIKTNRFYVAIWLLVSLTLVGFGVYGLIIENIGLGATCMTIGLLIGLIGCITLAIKQSIANRRKKWKIK